MNTTRALAGRLGAASLALLLKLHGASKSVVATAVVMTLDLPERGPSRRCALTDAEVEAIERECREVWRLRDARRRERSAAA